MSEMYEEDPAYQQDDTAMEVDEDAVIFSRQTARPLADLEVRIRKSA